MLEDYEINEETLAILPVTNSTSKIMEEENVYFINKSPLEVLDNSCKFFGSSYQGRTEGAKSLLGFNYKSPVLVEEKNNIIFFPTTSPRSNSCEWISLNNIRKYNKKEKSTEIIFKNGRVLQLDMSYYMLENQLFRATRLKDILYERVNSKK